MQGVGFRPFVYQVASRLAVAGRVWNDADGVAVEAEADPAILARLAEALVLEAPPLSRVEAVAVERLEPAGLVGFAIAPSQPNDSGGSQEAGVGVGTGVRALVPPDAAICPACRAELADSGDRRCSYPFITCTHCGPRFTITAALPYDRPQTTMAAFPLCADCAREYHDPSNRRFHAQPVACPDCGPRVWYQRPGDAPRTDWRTAFAADVAEGRIVAVRGLGGFHLICDAQNPQAVERLRVRKRRPHKPLAVMARDLSIVRRYCLLTPEEEALLTGSAAPILLLWRREAGGTDGLNSLPEALAPGAHTLGVMLPYTPLHLELFRAVQTELLVMTSGNRSGLPLETDNAGALAALGDVADGFLLHDREIANRCDDSVLRVMAGGPVLFRRSRGYVPGAIPVPVPEGVQVPPVVLGAGGETKSTFCLLAGGRAYLSQHIGDVGVREGEGSYRDALARLCRLLRLEPAVIGYDPHPGYRVSHVALELPGRHVAVQHHHAHLAAVLAEHGVVEPAIGIILDGTGFGPNGRLWGGEVLLGDLRHCERLAHLGYIPLPGGEAAIREPWRIGVALLYLAFGAGEALALAERLFPGRPVAPIMTMIARGLNTPLACGAGRWLDGAAALLGLCHVSTYDGHAAIALSDTAEVVAAKTCGSYPWRLAGGGIDLLEAVRSLVADRLTGVHPGIAGGRFQNALADAVVAAALTADRAGPGETPVALGGGAFQNPSLLSRVRERLERAGRRVLIPHQAPPGDGGLSLGQAVVALWAEV